MQNQIIECVPNFSEGVDMAIIKQITAVIEAVEGVKLLDVDPGKATNRTVVTFVGSPDSVIEAAFQAIKKAGELIDMRKHQGEHPRMGATDVCPLIPIANISMEETVAYAKKLSERVGNELGIPVYNYEYAASSPQRQNLAAIRAGEYEGFATKILQAEWKPDFGPAVFNAFSGATVIGARDFLIAYNVNLNTTSVRRANSIAFDIREKGRKQTDDKGKAIKNAAGEEQWTPGLLKSVKAIGWFIEEYGIAQISINLTNIHQTPMHVAFDTCCERATARGMRVTGSELVGLLPLQALLDAGKYFLAKQQRSLGVSDAELIKIAVRSLGLDELAPFDPNKKIIEYVMKAEGSKKLVDMTLTGFANETASESPAPGGGSIAAYCGVLGISLGTMVANLSSHKKGWDHRWKEFSDWAEQGQSLKDQLLHLVDEDTAAFNKIMDAFGMPKGTEEEKHNRKEAIEAATIYAIEVPFRTMKVTLESMPIIKAMANIGNPNSVSDAGVGAMCALTAIRGAYLNVQINAQDLKEQPEVKLLLEEAATVLAKGFELEKEIQELVALKIK
jgi:glutamate formiminotransferase/formiminotetrahydrofolate cyclodeaminase